MPSAIGQLLGIPEPANGIDLDAVAAHLAARDVLLLLDNCEHLPTLGAAVEDLLRTCSRIKVLATSRARSGIALEVEYALEPLAFPDPVR